MTTHDYAGLRAFAYDRISDPRERGPEGSKLTLEGVERQAGLIDKLGADLGVNIVRRFRDLQSAWDGRERPEYARMCECIARGECDLVLAYDSSRLWRDDLENALFMRLAEAAGVHVHFVHGGIVRPDVAADRMLSSIMTAVNRLSSADTSRRQCDKMTEVAQRGGFHGGVRGFGHANGNTELVQAEVDAIRDGAQRLLRGDSMRSIAADWNERGLTTPKGNPFEQRRVRALYAQVRLIGKREHKGAIYDTEWPTILDAETFECIQSVLAAKKATVAAPQARATKYLLTGFMRCHCGGKMHGSIGIRSNGRRYRIYKCRYCGMTITANTLDACIRDQVLAVLDSDDFRNAVTRAANATSDAALGDLMADLERKRAKLKEYAEMLDEDELTRAEYKERTGRVKAKITSLEEQLSAVTQSAPVHLLGQGDVLREGWEGLTVDEQRDVLRAVVEGIVVQRATSKHFDPARAPMTTIEYA